MNDPHSIVVRIEAFDNSLDEITDSMGGFLRCESCRRTAEVLSRYWRDGWPKCCDQTMRWWTQRQIDDGEMKVTR